MKEDEWAAGCVQAFVSASQVDDADVDTENVCVTVKYTHSDRIKALVRCTYLLSDL